MFLRPVFHLLKEKTEFLATVKLEKKVKDIAFIICNKEGLIQDISSSCFNMMGIDLAFLQSR